MPKTPSLKRQPVYLQICDLLMQRIGAGVWKPASALPNETELAREFGVSVGTVRKALDKLEGDRLLVREQGRGTFVLDQASGEMAIRFNNIRDYNGERIVGSEELLQQNTEPATAIEQARLALRPGDLVLRSRRLCRDQEGQPYMHEQASIAVSRLAGFDLCRVQDLSITTIAQKHGVHLARATEQVTVAEAAPEVAKLLLVRPGMMLFKLDRVLCAIDGQPIEWRVGLCHVKNKFYLAEMN